MTALSEIINRKKHYEKQGGQANFFLEKLEVVTHNPTNTYFVHSICTVDDGGHFKTTEVLEFLDKDGQWKNIKPELNPVEYREFLADCKKSNI